jgi:membrane associated rhomboid family serine protease
MSTSMPSSQPFEPSRPYNPVGGFGSSPVPGQSAPPAKKPGSALLPQRIKPALITVGALAAVMIIVQTINWATGYRLDSFGVEPRSLSDLWNVLTAPLVHASWGTCSPTWSR